MTRMVVAVWMTAAAALAQSPAQAVAPVSLSSSTAIRGQRLFATIVNPPAGQTQAQVSIGSNTQDAAIEAGGRIPFVVPGETSAHQPLAVGSYSVLIKIAGDLFPAGRLAVVRDIGSLADPTLRVKLDSVEPSYIQRKEKYVSFVARGRNFATDLPADNQLILNRAPYTGITWDDGCRVSGLPSPPPAKDSAPPPVHATAISSEELHFCNIPLPASGDLGVVIRQGTQESEQRVLPIRDWSKLGLMFFAGLVSALAVALVLALVANLKGSYFIKNQAYVLRALYLDTESDTYSLSKAQFYAWTIAALFAYSFFVLSKLIVQKTLTIPDVPGSLPGIIAIGAGTAVTAQFLSNVRGPKGAGDELPAISDFVTSGGVVAPERVQMVVWTLFGVIAFLLATILRDPTTIEGLPSVPDGLLYLSGISSLGYLSGKLTRKPGPVIAELSITPSQPSSALDAPPVEATLPVNAGAALTAAQQILLQLDAASGVSSNAAVTALRQAIAATTNLSTAANAAPVITQLATLRANAEAAATASAAEFDRLASAVPPIPEPPPPAKRPNWRRKPRPPCRISPPQSQKSRPSPHRTPLPSTLPPRPTRAIFSAASTSAAATCPWTRPSKSATWNCPSAC